MNQGASQETHEFTTSTLSPDSPVRAKAFFSIFFAAYTLTLLSASVYQPESLQYMYRDVRKALREKARMYSGVCDLYDRKSFLRNFKGRLESLEEFTAAEAFNEIDSPALVEELRRKYKRFRTW